MSNIDKIIEKELMEFDPYYKPKEIKGVPKAFWVVTYPTKVSELGDIVFLSNYTDLMLQAKGGLDNTDIYGIYANERDAEEVGNRLLAGR